MRVIIKPDYEQVTDWAATYIAYRINRARPTPAKPFVLGLPMGDTPKGMYKKLVELNRAGKLSFANVVIFCMNEFIGLEKNAPQSCQSYMDEYLLKHVDTKAANIYILDGRTKNYEKECSNFELAIRQKGGIDYRLFFICISVQVAPHVLHPVEDMPGFPLLRSLKNQVFYKMVHSLLILRLIARSGIDGKATISHVCRTGGMNKS